MATDRNDPPGDARKKRPEPSREAPLHGFALSGNEAETQTHRLNLPPELAVRFEQVKELSTTGGQASLLLCQTTGASNDLVAVKLYDKPARIGKEDLRRVLMTLASPHIIEYREPYFGAHNGYWWEVFEYCPGGTLRELADESGGSLSLEQGVEVIRQLHVALSSIHSTSPQIVHRDIKPDNILVRAAEPLDVVLIDFGFAVEVALSREYRSGSRTLPYAAPETSGGQTGPSLDWWGLGMTMLELLSGEHPFRLPNGDWLSEGQISSHLSTQAIAILDLGDERFENLLRGLLTKDTRARWGTDEVGSWLRGEMPELSPEGAVAVSRSRARKVDPVEFAGALYTDPVALANALAFNWGEAGRKVVSTTFHELVDWTDQYFPDRSLAQISEARARRNEHVDLTVARVVAQLDPDANPVFMGERVDLIALPSLVARAATKEEKLLGLTEKLFESKALRAFALLAGHHELFLVDSRWSDHCEAASDWFAAVPTAGGFTPQARALILRLAAEEIAAEADRD